MAALLARRERDGLSLQRLSRETGIPVGTLSWWSWRLRQTPEPGRGTTFVEVASATVATDAAVAVVLADGTRIEMAAGFDPAVLRAVVGALRSC